MPNPAAKPYLRKYHLVGACGRHAFDSPAIGGDAVGVPGIDLYQHVSRSSQHDRQRSGNCWSRRAKTLRTVRRFLTGVKAERSVAPI
jgi:hypothetical protein